jgi:CheY-like chemotaxis protein
MTALYNQRRIPDTPKHSMLILMIDDDSDDAELFCSAVKVISSSINCLTSKGSEEALILLNQHPATLPDVIFLDINMPKIDGRQCLLEIRKNKQLEHIPVFMYSISALYKDLDFFKRMNAKFLVKPGDFSGIVTALRDCLKTLEEK